LYKTCCGYICKQGKTGDEYGVWCETCGKRGKGKTADATDALAVYLKDNGEVRVELDGAIVPVAK
jgi:hypothetical protein